MSADGREECAACGFPLGWGDVVSRANAKGEVERVHDDCAREPERHAEAAVAIPEETPLT